MVHPPAWGGLQRAEMVATLAEVLELAHRRRRQRRRDGALAAARRPLTSPRTRHDQPLVGLGDAPVDRLIRLRLPGAGLVGLEGVEVEGLPFLVDGLPGEELAHRLLELLQARAVGREDRQRVTDPYIVACWRTTAFQ